MYEKLNIIKASWILVFASVVDALDAKTNTDEINCKGTLWTAMLLFSRRLLVLTCLIKVSLFSNCIWILKGLKKKKTHNPNKKYINDKISKKA